MSRCLNTLLNNRFFFAGEKSVSSLTLGYVSAIGFSLLSLSQVQSAEVRFLFPNSQFQMGIWQEIKQTAEEYNRIYPEKRVRLEQKGQNFSSLNEFIHAQAAGRAPDLATIGAHQLEAIDQLAALQGFSDSVAKPLQGAHQKSKASRPLAIPLALFSAVVAADQEILFRYDLDPNLLPGTQEALLKKLEQMAAARTQNPEAKQVLALPTQGHPNQWIAEVFFWGSKNRETKLDGYRRLFADAYWAKPGQTQRQCVDLFIKRETPMALISAAMLPEIQSRALFKWHFINFKKESRAPFILHGMYLIQTRQSPELEHFLRYLYSDRVAAKWASRSGAIPLRDSWTKTPEWRQSQQSHKRLLQRPISKFTARLHPRSRKWQESQKKWDQYLKADLSPREPSKASQDLLQEILALHVNP